MQIEFTTLGFKEGRIFVAHTPALDVSSCGGTKEKALRNFKEAVRLFLEEAGYLKRRDKLEGPKFVGIQRVSISLHPPLADAKG